MSKTLDPSQPVHLAPVHIPKPWGQEIWFTGIEERGESEVVLSDGRRPLSEFLALDPDNLTAGRPLLLLKILDPLVQPVRGDLYFEVHEQKQEVYVVTHVDETAWPDGIGAIRFGMNQQRRRGFANDTEFRRAYLRAVQAYETVRRGIDEGRDIEPENEIRLREAMDAFTDIRPLEIGDVVKVPTWFPHSLQHGVRVVEFQTPTYERFVLSFAQKVLTQDHWDTTEVLERIDIAPPEPERFEHVADGIQRIARFDDFNVWRVDLTSEAFTLPEHIPYAVCMTVTGVAKIGQLTLQPEAACLIPNCGVASTALSGTGQLLIAAPQL